MQILCYLFDVQYGLIDKHIFFPHTKVMLSEIHSTIATAETVSWFHKFISLDVGSKLASGFTGLK